VTAVKREESPLFSLFRSLVNLPFASFMVAGLFLAGAVYGGFLCFRALFRGVWRRARGGRRR
jgi:hypothetical protein